MIKNILFPVDFSPSCVAVAPYVKRATSIFGANVTLVHVCDLASHNGFELYARAADDIAEEHWNLARSRLEVFLESEFPAKESPRILLAGDAARAITETATKSKCDLIMMPTHAGRFRRMLLGSTTANVLSDANCPVLTTQHAAAIAPPVSGTPEVGLRSRIVIGFRKVTPLRERGRVGGERKAVGRSCNSNWRGGLKRRKAIERNGTRSAAAHCRSPAHRSFGRSCVRCVRPGQTGSA